jgi:hypothetical protein
MMTARVTPTPRGAAARRRRENHFGLSRVWVFPGGVRHVRREDRGGLCGMARQQGLALGTEQQDMLLIIGFHDDDPPPRIQDQALLDRQPAVLALRRQIAERRKSAGQPAAPDDHRESHQKPHHDQEPGEIARKVNNIHGGLCSHGLARQGQTPRDKQQG